MQQLALGWPQRGGKRKGAGRKLAAPRPRVSHKPRPRFNKATPVLVTLRVAFGVWNLRSRRCFQIVEDCLGDARDRFGLRVTEFSVLGNHLHLVVEADSDLALSRGMQGLNVRIARALNRRDRIRSRKSRASLWGRAFGARPILLFRIRSGTTPSGPVASANMATLSGVASRAPDPAVGRVPGWRQADPRTSVTVTVPSRASLAGYLK